MRYAGFAIFDPTYANLELVDSNEGADLGEEDLLDLTDREE